VNIRKFIATILMCSTFAAGTMGCYSLDVVNAPDIRSARDEHSIVSLTTADGNTIVSERTGIDSTRIHDAAIGMYMNDGSVTLVPLDSVRTIRIRKTNWPATIAMATVAIPLAGYGLFWMLLSNGTGGRLK